MSIGDVVALMRDGVFEILTLVAPVLGAALIIGLVVAIFQATTRPMIRAAPRTGATKVRIWNTPSRINATTSPTDI